MRDRRDWHEIQSTHARVLEALESAVAAHPAGKGGARPSGRERLRAVDADGGIDAGESRRLQPVASGEIYAQDAVVVPFRPRVVTLVPRIIGAGEHDPDDPTAA